MRFRSGYLLAALAWLGATKAQADWETRLVAWLKAIIAGRFPV